ncbi:uncharacterized protein LOC126708362 [Quercus robur]|uniref:uncharacterized protein LOC126708362 n=1 Tax=Quercus robur TaxID=38942 RepID=UPI0021631E66|nr:uncharacterized protein LOC126708362 [Quercus robur]
MDTEAKFYDEFLELPIGEKVVKFFGSTKTRIRVPWTNALIVKVFGKTVGYHFLHSRIISLWKPIGRMDCVDLGNDFFLIKFQAKEDHARVLREGPCFVGGHYLSIRPFSQRNLGKNKTMRGIDTKVDNIYTVGVGPLQMLGWGRYRIRLLELPIEYYETSTLKEIGKAIGLVLRIDTHTATESRGRFARLYVQVNFNEPIIKLLKMGGIDQPVQYERINSMCFACGHVGYKAENYHYKISSLAKGGVEVEARNSQDEGKQKLSKEADDAFGPWVLVA